jgi:hypothetical protein
MTPLCGRPLLALSMARMYSSPTSFVMGNNLSALMRAIRPSLLAPLVCTYRLYSFRRFAFIAASTLEYP